MRTSRRTGGSDRQIESIREATARTRCYLDAAVMVKELNEELRGWANYYRLGTLSKIYQRLDDYVTDRLRRWLCHKHKIRGGTRQYPDEYLYRDLGLVRLRVLKRNPPWARA